MNGPVSGFTGSKVTRSMVEEQILARWGEAEVKKFDPYHTARTFPSWLSLGYKVKKGEVALRSIAFVEKKNSQGEVIRKYRRPVFLFLFRQVEPLSQTKSI